MFITPRLTRWGIAADYRGAHALDAAGRLVVIADIYRREVPVAYMARLRRMNGEEAGEQALTTLRILPRE